jgi:L-cysteine:1D-myo-inositol 2-amino-2-deoxy-alpha-D-glucopyranoside ligase
MVAYEGEKMSKSRGNLVFVSRLRADGVDPMAIRLALLRHHYRSDWEWTEDELTIAQEWLDDFRLAAGEPAGAASGPVVAAVREALADELDAPTAVAAIREWAGRTNEGSDRSETGAGSVVRTLLDSLLGILL